MIININIINIVPDYIEKYIIKKFNLNIPKVFRNISNKELKYIQNKVKSKFKVDIDSGIISSTKSTYVKNYIVNTHYKLKLHKDSILSQYQNNKQILDLSKKYKLTPMTIMRYILETKYSKKIKSLYNNLSLLNNYDRIQFDIALNNDVYNQIEQIETSIESEEFERKIETILISYNIKYKTQKELIDEQTQQYGYAKSTPDFLILDELYINNHQITWIDAKNYYGANIQFIIKSINKQINKYNKLYGTGCIIFKYGFNDKLKFDKTLLLSIESFKK
jgi:hypothetical protein